ncbi:hypothetical protein F4808DRAFT_314414 [Astrocystis sublimbata]|nr:hypothetical protein F4808DRAFT_314414 [Astrocystis sublimbata]
MRSAAAKPAGVWIVGSRHGRRLVPWPLLRPRPGFCARDLLVFGFMVSSNNLTSLTERQGGPHRFPSLALFSGERKDNTQHPYFLISQFRSSAPHFGQFLPPAIVNHVNRPGPQPALGMGSVSASSARPGAVGYRSTLSHRKGGMRGNAIPVSVDVGEPEWELTMGLLEYHIVVSCGLVV